MLKKRGIDRPIFLVGSGRSGSTLLYRILGGHPDLAWFSNFSTRLKIFPQIAILSKIYYKRQEIIGPDILKNFIPVPSEGYEIWDHCIHVENSPNDPPLTNTDVNNLESDCIRKMISTHLKWQGSNRFINKNIRNTRRIEYLNSEFPDAYFIHIIRDPRASVASLLNVSWWSDLNVWCQDMISPEEWIREGKDPSILAAIIWKEENRYLLDRLDIMGDRYLQVYYEDLVSNPILTIDLILKHCNIVPNDKFNIYLKQYPIRNMNYKFQSQLSQKQQEQILRLAEPIIERIKIKYS